MSGLPPAVQRVCSRCGEPVTVGQFIVCPTHGVIHNPRHVMTRADWLLLQATVARHPAGKGQK